MLSLLLAAAVSVSATCDLERPSGQRGCTRAAVDALPMNAVQAIGTHNSYKQAIAPLEMAAIQAMAPAVAAGLDYAHPPLAAQLDAGARQLELDLLHDPQGGRYADPVGLKRAGSATLPFDTAPLRRPGLKVLHAQDIDYRSSCPLFVECLREIRTWSKAHPDHIPLLILINLKEDAMSSVPGATPALRFDPEAMDTIDREIRSVFAERELITPDQVRGRRATLREAVTRDGWPRLTAARGRVLFALDAPPDQVERYRRSSSFNGRVLFPNVEEASPDAAYITLNDPAKQAKRIRAAVAAGLIVRTRADADTLEARRNDTSRQTTAFRAGAQYVSTDYMQPDPRLSTYRATLPGGGVARRSPAFSGR